MESGLSAILNEDEWAVIFRGLQFAGQRLYLLEEQEAEQLHEVMINLISQVANHKLMAQIEGELDGTD
ncbi:hypothetical protein SEA_NICEHOUSE_233 [Rhodococcus phage NiceHouse]|nr:hypothetical protein SEA_NICEHOUSE_233 [Rhodococcus phage NiceHouse]